MCVHFPNIPWMLTINKMININGRIKNPFKNRVKFQVIIALNGKAYG